MMTKNNRKIQNTDLMLKQEKPSWKEIDEFNSIEWYMKKSKPSGNKKKPWVSVMDTFGLCVQ